MTTKLLTSLVALGVRLDRAEAWQLHIANAMSEFGINTQQRQAMFLSQILHESGSLHYTTEIWGNTAAQISYEGRKNLGNTETGDGFKYRGRGLIQVTGRSNYTQVATALGIDCVNDPDILAEPVNAARSAAWWWKSRNLNKYADACDIVGCTKVINGGTNGLEHRQKLYAQAMSAVPLVSAVVETAPMKSPIVAVILTIFKGISKVFSKG